MRLKPGKFFVRWRCSLEPGGAKGLSMVALSWVVLMAFLLRLIADNLR